MTFPALHLLPLGLCLVAATCWDLAQRRIPNGIVGAVALAGLLAQIADRGIWAAASGVGAAILVIAILYRPWTAGGIGGGDVKLAAAVAVWVGLGGMVRYSLAVAVAGGLVALASYLLSARAVKKEVRVNLTLAALNQGLPAITSAPGRVTVPYGLAISIGAVVALWKA